MTAPSQELPQRLAREARTVEAMIRLYCRDHHGGEGALCEPCGALNDYARDKLLRCPFQGDKPTCDRCTVHCYRDERREEIRTVMRYAGPRMLRHHPMMALRHLLDSRRPTPGGPGRG